MADAHPITYLDGRRVRRLLLAGSARLISARRHLDRINVYPVPDGDTGTNLSLTFAGIAARLESCEESHCGRLLEIAADAALDGARGNSGAIFAQFFQGAADATAGRERIEAGDIARILATSADYARTALDDPQEGTVLTVMSDMARAVGPGTLPAGSDFAALLRVLLEAAGDSVRRTRTGLPAMRAAGVEDAGARALLVLFEGMADGLIPGLAPPTAPRETGEDVGDYLRAQVEAAHGQALEHRYCTECLVAGSGMDQTRLKTELAEAGSSVVVVGSARKLRIHAHVDDPEQVFAIARRYGQVSAEKADDMARQEQSLIVAGRRVAVVSDSGADLPAGLWDELGVQLVPLRVNFGEQGFLDKAGLTSAGFFRELATNPEHPRTSQPPPGDFRRAYELLSSHYEHVVAVTLAAGLSGSHQAARAAAAQISRDGQVTVVDSLSASVGQGLVVLAAAERAREGADRDAVLLELEQCIAGTRAYGFVPDLRFAVRGGRLPEPWRWLASRLPLSFVVSVDGGRVRVRRVRWRRPSRGDAPLTALLGPALKDARGAAVGRIAIAHGDEPRLAERLREQCRQHFPDAELLVTELSPVFGVHGGPGTLALALQVRRETVPPESGRGDA